MKASMVLFAVLCGVPALVGAATGQITYTLEKAASPTADQSDAYVRIEKAMDSALGYYNTLTTIRKAIRVQYDASVPTADASSNGTLRFGSSRSYMVVGTAMHEIAHTVGVGTTAEYQALMVNGVFTGTRATATLREITGDNTAVLKGDAQHIWPYGINYASEVKSATDLVNHCKIIESLYKDLYRESIAFVGRIRSKSTGQCMVRTGTTLAMGACDDTTSLVRLVAMGDTAPNYRVEFGDRVIDAPNQSTTPGTKIGLYDWNRGTNQKLRIEGGSPATGIVVQLRMVHSSLRLEAVGNGVVQNPASSGTAAQSWELLDPATAALAPHSRTNFVRPGYGTSIDALGRPVREPRSPWTSLGH